MPEPVRSLIMIPVITPKAVPRTKVTGRTIINGMSPAISAAETAPQKARTDPTERSMPPVRITKVIPAAMIALIEVCLRTLRMLKIDRKRGAYQGYDDRQEKQSYQGFQLIHSLFIHGCVPSFLPPV